MLAKSSRTAFLSLLLALALLAAACGSDADPATAPADTSTTSAPPSNDAPDADTTTSAAPAETTSTTSTTTTEPPPAGPEPLDPDDIPELVSAWGAGTDDPLALAQRIIAFPLAIPVPDGTTAYGITVDMAGGDPESPWLWDWSYSALSDEALLDIDIDADDMGPGTIALSDRYDPIMADLGWRRTGTTGSDPSSGGGGPQSVNHVYQSESETVTVSGLTATPKPAFVWADEELEFGGERPGFRVDLPLEFEPGVVPVPLIQAIIDSFPKIVGAQLVDVDLDSRDRPDTSFDAEYGLRYIEINLEWVIPPGTDEEAKTAYSTGLDSTLFAAGSESFFDPGFFGPEEPTVSGDRWTQSVVFLNRYEGRIEIEPEAGGESIVSLRLLLEPGRTGLEPVPAD